jgi:DNA-binding CsgD family transcriptional regulator
MTSRPGPELQELIGTEAFVALAEEFGGTRLFIPVGMGADHPIARAVGLPAARLLSQRLAPDVLKVPLAREERARHYRDQRLSNAQIARRLGITEGGVERLFRRRRERGDDPQSDLFTR